jgi:hypothetical protein
MKSYPFYPTALETEIDRQESPSGAYPHGSLINSPETAAHGPRAAGPSSTGDGLTGLGRTLPFFGVSVSLSADDWRLRSLCLGWVNEMDVLTASRGSPPETLGHIWDIPPVGQT